MVSAKNKQSKSLQMSGTGHKFKSGVYTNHRDPHKVCFSLHFWLIICIHKLHPIMKWELDSLLLVYIGGLCSPLWLCVDRGAASLLSPDIWKCWSVSIPGQSNQSTQSTDGLSARRGHGFSIPSARQLLGFSGSFRIMHRVEDCGSQFRW